jgi:2-(1,2-epoxy-1,2-dihydrophenyl)acetyl-CoA isomerase
MSAAEFLYTKLGGVATMTLNRPDRLNAFTKGMIDAWYTALLDAAADPAVHVVVVTGTGRAFCSGGDLGGLSERAGNAAAALKDVLWEDIHRIPKFLESFDKPYIVALNGMAIGAGLDLALMADYRIAARSARFRQGYLAVGIVPGDGGAYYLPRIVGISRALEMFWTTRWVESAEALEMGLVDRVVDDGALEAAIAELARTIADGPQLAIRMTKRLVRQSLNTDLMTSLDLVSSHMAVVKQDPDHAEGLAAMRERRKPRFGRRQPGA